MRMGARTATSDLVSSPKGFQSSTSLTTDAGNVPEPHTAPASITGTPRSRPSPPRKLHLRPRARTPDPEREPPPLSPATADDHHAQAYASAYTPSTSRSGTGRDNLGYSIGRVGVPLTRVFTAPGAGQYEYGQYSGSAGYGEFGAGDDEEDVVAADGTTRSNNNNASRVGAEGRRRGSANKLVRMGFAVRDPYGNTPGSSGPGTPNSSSILASVGGSGAAGGGAGVGMLSRSPPKRALGGLRNLVQSLKGKT